MRRKRKFAPQYCVCKSQLAQHRTPRPEGQAFEGAAVLPQCDFTFVASIEVVEDRGWQTALGDAAQIFKYSRRGAPRRLGCVEFISHLVRRCGED